MNIIKKGIAGTLESSDIQVIIEPYKEKGIEIELKSSVEKQYGRQIRNTIEETLSRMNIDNVRVIAIDKGALDCTIKARVQCASFRAADINNNYNWEEIE